MSNDKINPYDLGDVGRRMRRADLPTQRHLPPRDELADLRTEVARLKAELVALKGRTCATCANYCDNGRIGMICTNLGIPREPHDFCSEHEPKAPKPNCDNCRHWALAGFGFGRGFCELRPDDGRNWYCCDTCPKWESKEAADA